MEANDKIEQWRVLTFLDARIANLEDKDKLKDQLQAFRFDLRRYFQTVEPSK